MLSGVRGKRATEKELLRQSARGGLPENEVDKNKSPRPWRRPCSALAGAADFFFSGATLQYSLQVQDTAKLRGYEQQNMNRRAVEQLTAGSQIQRIFSCSPVPLLTCSNPNHA